MDELNKKAGEQSILLKTKQDEADAALQEITVSMQVLYVIISKLKKKPPKTNRKQKTLWLPVLSVVFKEY